MRRKVLEFRPTQIAIGMREVTARAAKLRTLKAKELDDYLASHKIPAVLGPLGRVYLGDHHHLVRACWEAGIVEVPVELQNDHSKLDYKDFWPELRKANWLYPYDQFGGGPHDPIQLPEDIRGLADDPFRSLAWDLREAGGFAKTDVPYMEFMWANFLRSRMTLHPVYHKNDEALKEALKLSKSTDARTLPGYKA